MKIRKRVFNILIAFDQLLWVLITLGAGHPDETISSAMYRFEKMGHPVGKFCRPALDLIFLVIFFDKHHCRKAYLSERFRRQAPRKLFD